MNAPLTGLTREIADAISAANRRIASNERRDITVAEMAQAVVALLEPRLLRDFERLAAALEDVREHCRSASAVFATDHSIPSVKQMIALSEIHKCVTHNLTGIVLSRANARAVAAEHKSAPIVEFAA